MPASASAPRSPAPISPNLKNATVKPEKTPENLTSRYPQLQPRMDQERADSLDIAWLKDDNAEDAADLPEPAVLAQEAMETGRGAGGIAGDIGGVG